MVFDVLVAAVGEYVGQQAQDRLVGGGAGLGEFEDARCEPHPQRHGLFDGGQMGGVQHAPGRDGEFHHRREGVNLRRAHDQVLVNGRLIEEGCEFAAADQVGADKRVPHQPGGDHVGDELFEVGPMVALVAEALHEWPARELSGGAIHVLYCGIANSARSGNLPSVGKKLFAA